MKKRVLFYLFTSLISLNGFAQTSSDSLKISVRTTPGAEIGIDSEMSSTNTLSKTVSCGKHKVVVTCGNDFKKEYEIDVTPGGKTSFEYDVRGNFAPKFKQSNATVYVDGIKYSSKENIPTLGVHNVVAYGYPDMYLPTEITTVVNPLEENQNTIYKLNKKKPNLSGFILANYMFRVNAPGLMMGIGRRFGGYMKFNIGLGGVSGNKAYPSSYNGYPMKSFSDVEDKFFFNEDVKTYKQNKFFDFCAGVTYKPINFLSIYLGAGYYASDHGGFYVESNHDDSSGTYHYYGLYAANKSSGLMMDLGVIARYRALLLQFGYSRGFAMGDSFGNLGEINVGIGVNIHKNKRK